MPFTRTWDSTQPPDTQLANLLGQDIRNLKEDISERLSAFGAGPIANRPTPEAAFGSATIGVMYFATDEGKLYSWSGTAWVLVFCRHLITDTTLHSNNSAVQVTLTSAVIPAAFLSVGMHVRYRTHISYGGGTMTSGTTLFLLVAGTQLTSFGRASGSNVFDADVTFDGIVSGPTSMSWAARIGMHDVPSGVDQAIVSSDLTAGIPLVLNLANPTTIAVQNTIVNFGTVQSDFSSLELLLG